MAGLLLIFSVKDRGSLPLVSNGPPPARLVQVVATAGTALPAPVTLAHLLPSSPPSKEPPAERFLRLPATVAPEEAPIAPTNVPKATEGQPDENLLRYASYASAGTDALLTWYDDNTGLWRDAGWWNSANALTAVADYSLVSGDDRYISLITNTFEKNKDGKFLNDYYDDEGWWALAWIKAYDLTGQARYLEAAEILFQDMQGSWDSVCNGGIWWSREKTYKNAIANELFIAVAAQLHLRTPPDRSRGYLAWAQEGWNWFRGSGLINGSSLVNDGLSDSCQNNGQATWSYNQGVILGALLDLYSGTKDILLLDQAVAIADATLGNLVNDNGILGEQCEPRGVDDADQPQFKGILIRNLARLYEATDKPEYRAFILHNADSLWLNSREPDSNYFGGQWSGPFRSASPSKQGSGVDALNAALQVYGK